MINVNEKVKEILINEYSQDPEIVEMMFEDKLFGFRSCRNYLIRYEFQQKRYSLNGSMNTVEKLIEYLSDKYCVSIKTVRGVIYQKF